MTTVTTIKPDIRFFGLPRNKTGLFAADTIHEVKPTRNHLITVPPLSPQFRHSMSTNLLLASSEQNHHQFQQYHLSKNEIQQYYPLDKNSNPVVDSSNDARVTLNGIRNGFRPSTVRHQKLRVTTANPQRNNSYYENKDLSTKSGLLQSHASAKIRSEIDQINNKLIKQNKESSKSLRLLNSRELDETPRSALSYSTSYHESTASPILTADRIHQRFTSAITHITGNTRATLPTITDTSNQPTQILSGIAGPSPAQALDQSVENEQDTTNYRPTHAYQIPQQSNVGSESIFLLDPPSLSSMKTRSAKYDRYTKDPKSVSCPFYVMYLTNLAMQQRQNKEDNNPHNKENEVSTLTMASTIRKVPVNSRTSTANPKRLSTKRQVNSPISIHTYATVDDDDRMTNSTATPHMKRFPNKLSTGENEKPHVLRDILRTSSWNHVQV